MRDSRFLPAVGGSIHYTIKEYEQKQIYLTRLRRKLLHHSILGVGYWTFLKVLPRQIPCFRPATSNSTTIDDLHDGNKLWFWRLPKKEGEQSKIPGLAKMIEREQAKLKEITMPKLSPKY
jgi:hypothetical protein